MRIKKYASLTLLAVASCTGSIGDSGGGDTSGGSPSSTGTDGAGTGMTGASGGASGSVGGTASTGGVATGSTGGSTDSGTSSTGSDGSACTPLQLPARRLWRLSVEQYQNAVRDLLGLATTPELTNRGGEAQYAFFGDATLGVDPDFQFALFQAVDALLPSIPSSVTACKTGEMPTACATRIAQTLGAKAFRRPLSSTEIAALVTNTAKAATGTTPAVSAAPFVVGSQTDTATGIKLMIEAILLSPSFIYRTELGPSTLAADASGNYPATTLSPYEVAAQLGFTFLGTLPDDQLEAAAADTSSNGLGSATGIAAQIDRLLTLPTVRQNLTAIMIDMFNVRQLFGKNTKDSSLLASLPAADQADPTNVQNDLYTSTFQLFTDVLWTGSGKITDLLTTQKFYANSRLAALFPDAMFSGSRPNSTTTFVAGTWPDSEDRIGILSYPSYLWGQSDVSLNSIVKRGKAIHDDVICADALPGPIDLSQPAAAAIVAMGDSEITHSDARLAPGTPCVLCHAQMDPYARVIQHFGPIGNYRTVDEAGRPIDTSVKFAGGPLDGQSIAGPKELAQGLVESGRINGCAVQKIASYMLGAMIRTYDTCELGPLRSSFNQSDGTVASLFRNVALADFVRNRNGGTK